MLSLKKNQWTIDVGPAFAKAAPGSRRTVFFFSGFSLDVGRWASDVGPNLL